MTGFKIIEKIRASAGLSVKEFAHRMSFDPSTWYKWRDGTNDPSPGIIARTEKEFRVRIAKNAKGDIIGVDPLPPVADIADESEPCAGDQDPERQMVLWYEQIAQRLSRPRWEKLDEELRARMRQILYLAEVRAAQARKEAEAAILELIGEQQRRRE